MTAVVSRMGAFLLGQIAQLGELLLLLAEILRTTFTRRPRWAETIEQIFKIGWQSQAVVLLTGAFTGMVFTVQTGIHFHRVRLDTAVGAVVSLAMTRELAPVLTALMVAGRVGSAIAAEIGSMKVTEQLDALRTMGAPPVAYLAVPRFVAMLVALPLLTAEAMLFGIVAGYLVAVGMLGIDGAHYLEHSYRFTAAKDVACGLVKAAFFGMFIGWIACFKGFTAGAGAEGVGRAATQAVVVSSMTVLISNFFIAVLFNFVFPP
jgi:phospholipid/cholesterol/gamma-HCH transport system permease protein